MFSSASFDKSFLYYITNSTSNWKWKSYLIHFFYLLQNITRKIHLPLSTSHFNVMLFQVREFCPQNKGWSISKTLDVYHGDFIINEKLCKVHC